MTTAREWIAILEQFPPDEQIIGMFYRRELFGDEMLTTKDGDSEYAECPLDVWDDVAERHELRDWICEQIHDDIRMDLQEAIDAREEVK